MESKFLVGDVLRRKPGFEWATVTTFCVLDNVYINQAQVFVQQMDGDHVGVKHWVVEANMIRDEFLSAIHRRRHGNR